MFETSYSIDSQRQRILGRNAAERDGGSPRVLQKIADIRSCPGVCLRTALIVYFLHVHA